MSAATCALARPRGAGELGAEVRAVDAPRALGPRCALPSCPHPAIEGEDRCGGHLAEDLHRPAAPPLTPGEFAALLSSVMATSRSYARRYSARGAAARAASYAAIECACDVLFATRRLGAQGFLADTAPEDVFLRRLHSQAARLTAAAAVGAEGPARVAFDVIAATAAGVVCREVRALLLGVPA